MLGIRNVALGLSVLGASLFADSACQASDCYHGQVRYKTVTVYRTVRIPVYYYVTKYSYYGSPYRVQAVTYRYASVRFQKQVRIGY